ncbi:unnamed protein product [Mytilus coruscus]|uniref:Uncharacterized protein n=1 Tax=Mytilus coruscus TaxID=42192 RepID=A0A6J8CG23_MYTCO|nr:unnamed protein product [Mytilus coruscus]
MFDQPYKFTKATLDETKAGSVQSTKDEVEKHLSETHSDERQWEHLGNCEKIENVPEPEISMNVKEQSWKEVVDVVKKDTHVQAIWVLKALEMTVTCSRMDFKPMKSRPLIIRNGKSTHQVELKVQGEVIPSIIDNPIKCLGKGFEDSLSDKNNIGRIEQHVSQGNEEHRHGKK